MSQATAKHDELVERLRALRLFLNGEAPLGDLWFGDTVERVGGRIASFWWRKDLHAITEAAQALTDLQAELDGLREAMQPLADAAKRIEHFDGEHYNGSLYAMERGGALRELIANDEPVKVEHLRTVCQALSQHPHDSLGGR